MYKALFLMVGCPPHITQGHSSLKPQNLARATTWPFPRGIFARFSKFCFNGSHWPYVCRLSLGSQWGAPTGHIGRMLKSPPATGRPVWRSGHARARGAGLRTPLGSCAARVRRAAESAAAPAADHGRVRDGWCYEHQCHRAPSRGRLRRARQPQLQCAGAQAARSLHTFLKV